MHVTQFPWLQLGVGGIKLRKDLWASWFRQSRLEVRILVISSWHVTILGVLVVIILVYVLRAQELIWCEVVHHQSLHFHNKLGMLSVLDNILYSYTSYARAAQSLCTILPAISISYFVVVPVLFPKITSYLWWKFYSPNCGVCRTGCVRGNIIARLRIHHLW